MPGPVSDGYDPEFGIGENAALVEEEVRKVRDKISSMIGSDKRLPILEVIDQVGEFGRPYTLNERTLRIIRFAMDRALESL